MHEKEQYVQSFVPTFQHVFVDVLYAVPVDVPDACTLSCLFAKSWCRVRAFRRPY